MPNRPPSDPINRVSPEAFTHWYIKHRRGKYPGLHTVYSGFNQEFRARYPKLHPVAFTQALAAKGKIGLRIVRGGAMLFLPGELKHPSGRFTEATRSPEPHRTSSRTRFTDDDTGDISHDSDEPDDLDDSYPVHAIARDCHVTPYAVLRQARSLGIQLLTEFAEISPDDEARIRRSFKRKAGALTTVRPRKRQARIPKSSHRKNKRPHRGAAPKKRAPTKTRGRGRADSKSKRTATARPRSTRTASPATRRSDGSSAEDVRVVPDERPSVIAGDPNPQDTTGPASASPAAESTRRDGPSTQGVSSQIEELKAFYEDYAASLEGEISKLKGETTDLRAELSAARQSSAQLTTREVTQDDVPQVPEDERPPSSVEEAVKVAAAECENLLFLDEAFQSAAASAYLQPGKVLETLRTLNGVAERYRANDLPRGFKVACEETGLRYAADISQTAKGKYGRYYRRQYNGRSVMLGPHIQLGKGSPDTCARIYFYLDPAERLVVIGHVGKHLPDTNS